VVALLGKNYPAMIAAIGTENICGGLGTAAFVAFLTSLCDKRFTATQYALLSSLMAMSRVLAGVPTGFMAKSLGLAHVLRRERPGDLAVDPVCALAKGQSGVGGFLLAGTFRSSYSDLRVSPDDF
jgi:hypothetical protein